MRPEFTELMTRYAEIHEAGQSDTAEARALLSAAMRYAPPEFLEMARREARALGLLPEPDGYLADGTRAYSVATVAAHLGVTEAEVIEGIDQLSLEQEALGLPVEELFVPADAVHGAH